MGKGTARTTGPARCTSVDPDFCCNPCLVQSYTSLRGEAVKSQVIKLSCVSIWRGWCGQGAAVCDCGAQGQQLLCGL